MWMTPSSESTNFSIYFIVIQATEQCCIMKEFLIREGVFSAFAGGFLQCCVPGCSNALHIHIVLLAKIRKKS